MIKGGYDIDDEGVARALKPDDVRRFADYLTGVTDAELDQRHNAGRMNALKIYPIDDWNRRSVDDDPRQWLRDAFRALRAFVQRAAEAGDGLVVHIS